MSARPLKSDQVNYLIWRYLQESGHAQTAARLQRDWAIGDPQRLPFARHIRTHALVHLLSKGLRYHELEASIDPNGQQKPSSSFFGPDSATATPPHTGADDHEANSSRKHLREGVPNDTDSSQVPSAKRSRRGNGAAINGRIKGGDGMEIDQATTDSTAKREQPADTSTLSPSGVVNNIAPSEMELDSRTGAEANSQLADSAYPRRAETAAAAAAAINQELEPAAGETVESGATGEGHQQQQQQHQQDEAQASSESPVTSIVPTLVNGSSVGVQGDKGAELGPETGVLGLPGKNVTHALWNPRDPAKLAAAGDALCRLWTLPTAPTPPNGFTKPHGPRNIEPINLVDLNADKDAYYVTSIAWSDDGHYLAVAKHPTTPGRRGVVGIYDHQGTILDELPGSQDFVLSLVWSPQSTLLLGISHSGEDNSSVTAWDVTNARAIVPLKVNHTIWDASWVDDRQFWMCADSYLGKGEVETSEIKLAAERSGDALSAAWSRIRHDSHSGTMTLSSDNSPGMIGCYGAAASFDMREAHSADITSLMYQPLANPAMARAQNVPRLVATASIEGCIKLWNVLKRLELVHTLDMGRQSPALAISFTPDGYLVAGASSDKILFWNAEIGGFPKASWYAKDAGGFGQAEKPYMNGNGHAIVNGDVDMKDAEDDEEAIPMLGWDADGKKLVCAVRNELAVISLRR